MLSLQCLIMMPRIVSHRLLEISAFENIASCFHRRGNCRFILDLSAPGCSGAPGGEHPGSSVWLSVCSFVHTVPSPVSSSPPALFQLLTAARLLPSEHGLSAQVCSSVSPFALCFLCIAPTYHICKEILACLLFTTCQPN